MRRGLSCGAAFWVLAVAVAVAGCVGSDEPDEDADPFAEKPALEFRVPVDLGSKSRLGAAGTSCSDSIEDGDCGLGEPTVEVDGAGTIYVSGVCCITNPPPVLVSRDGGETFQDLAGDDVRELFGIEGDIAIDEDGTMFFADIELAATFQVTVWEADGTYVRHTKWPAPPLVDRDWIRAEGDGILYYVYNTGSATNVYKSLDAGMTWSPVPVFTADYGLGNVAIWPGHEICLAGGSGPGGNRLATCSTDGALSWSQEESTAPSGGNFPVPVFDETGRLYIASGAGEAISYAWRGEDGWSEPVTVSPNGTHRMPWAAAGGDGALALAWYGTPDEDVTAQSAWYLYVAATRDATAAEPRWDWVHADADPVFVGELGRDLLDFFQIDMGPDGALHVAYSDQYPVPEGGDGNEEQLRYVRSEPSPLAMQDFWWGPSPATTPAHTA